MQHSKENKRKREKTRENARLMLQFTLQLLLQICLFVAVFRCQIRSVSSYLKSSDENESSRGVHVLLKIKSRKKKLQQGVQHKKEKVQQKLQHKVQQNIPKSALVLLPDYTMFDG